MKIKIFAALALCSFQLWAEDFNAEIRDGNKVLANVLVNIKLQDLQQSTSSEGLVTFKDLPPGSYSLDIEVTEQKHFNIKVNHVNDNLQVIDISVVSLDHIVVSSNPLEHNSLKMTTPATLISESDLVLNRGLNINETLSEIPGVNSASFGAGSGQPVIRGQQGNRVTVLNNNSSTQDAANVSPDHWITAEPLLASQIEVLKGPATLLYGGQAVGGVVNVVDNTIPSAKLDSIEGGVEFRLSDSALNERSAVVSLNAPLGENVMAHVSYFNSQTDSYEIPGHAESEILEESEGHEHDDVGDEHGDEEDEHGHEAEEGYLENSDIDSSGFNVGLSYVYDNGYWGFSASDYDRNYGIPGHAHHEEEHDDEEDHGDEEEEEIVRIDLEKRNYNFRGRHQFDNDFFKALRVNFTSTDYQHVELEGDEIGTLFDNEANELRVELTHNHALGFDGVFGLQVNNRDFSAIGDEAFILPSETRSVGLFLIEERDFENWHFEAGLRYDRQTVKTDLYPDITDNTFSFSTGATFNLNDSWTLPVNFAHASRLPTAEELFSNQSGAEELIPHLATSIVEVGNPNLTDETANNFDIGLRYRNEGLRMNVSFYHNKINDFIFLNPTGDEVEELPVFNYDQRDATFKGYEFEASQSWSDSWENQWMISLMADKTDAEDDNGNNIPRIPPQRVGAGLQYGKGSFLSNLKYYHVSSQNDIAEYELPTEGYDLLNLDLSYVFYHGLTESTVFFKASNLLDEEIRDHSSFVKDVAPRPGRSLSAGVRINF